jgi:hypothetical protein
VYSTHCPACGTWHRTTHVRLLDWWMKTWRSGSLHKWAHKPGRGYSLFQCYFLPHLWQLGLFLQSIHSFQHSLSIS